MSAVTVLPARGPGIRAVVADVHAALDRADECDDTGPAVVGEMLREIDRATNRLAALRLRLVAEADKANLAASSGASGTSAWLATTTRTGGGSAAGQVALATALDSGLPATGAAMKSGEVSAAHAAIIVGTMRDLPEGLTATQRDAIEAALVRDARQVDPARLKKSATRALAAATVTAEAVDQHQEQVLRTAEERAWDTASLTLHDHGDGTTSGHFRVPTLAGAILRKVIQQMVSPRRDNAGRAEQQRAARGERSQARGHDKRSQAGGHDKRSQPGEPGPQTERSEESRPSPQGGRTNWAGVDWATRNGQAFVQLLEHLPTDHLHGKAAANVVITIEHERHRRQLGAAHLDTGHDLSASDARRLACQAGILPAVLGGRSQILDLGRRRRFYSKAQHIALATIYDECSIEGCDRPYAWTELHHEEEWVRQRGRTDLDKAIPACGQHHRMIHSPRYTHTIRTAPNGRKSVTLHLRR